MRGKKSAGKASKASSEKAIQEPTAEASESTPLKDSLRKTNDAFEQLLNLIPKHFYLHADDRDDLVDGKRPEKRKLDDVDKSASKKQRIREGKKSSREDKSGKNAAEVKRTGDRVIVGTSKEVEGSEPLADDKSKAPKTLEELKEKIAAKAQRKSSETSSDPVTRQALLNQRSRVREAEKDLSEEAAVQGGVTFSNLDFDSNRKPKEGRKRKDAKPSVTSSDPTKALAALESRKNFLEKLGPMAKERAEEKDKWSHAEKRAEGKKVYDDESKLQKAIKKKEKTKAKSRKAWADRIMSVEEAKAARQAQRTANLAARKKSTSKSNPRRPGFEGGPRGAQKKVNRGKGFPSKAGGGSRAGHA